MLNSSTLMNELTLNGRRGSRKRRRLSERRRAFTRIGLGDSSATMTGEEPPQPLFGTRRDSGLYSARKGPQQVNKSRTGRAGQLPDRSVDSELTGSTGSLWPGGGGGGDRGKISMKIQFHIKVAPENEPLILDTSPMFEGTAAGSSSSLLLQKQQQQQPPSSSPPPPPTQAASSSTPSSEHPARQATLRKQSTSDNSTTAISDHINERLSRQNTLNASRRRQQLVALHNQQQQQQHPRQRLSSCGGLLEAPEGSLGDRDHHHHQVSARSSTISGGMQDEATLRFLARHQQQQQQMAGNDYSSQARLLGPSSSSSSSLLLPGGAQPGDRQQQQQQQRQDKIYFKRDGQRFGHEFTLKLAVDKNYRCLLKVRPLIPLQAISIQGHHVSFVDCSTSPSAGNLASLLQQQHHQSSAANAATTTATNSSSAPTSSMSLNSSWQSIDTPPPPPPPTHITNPLTNNSNNSRYHHQHHHHEQQQPHHLKHRLCHAQTTTGSQVAWSPLASGHEPQPARMTTTSTSTNTSTSTSASANANSSHSLNSSTSRVVQQQLLRHQQHQQMKRHFAASHCSPSGNPHLGSQLIYMFDWSAGRFEVNKNKDRTQLQTVLKFKNGEILSLPLQVKFYQPESRQHLEWGSQLHFIDYDCQINNMGQISVDRIQYY